MAACVGACYKGRMSAFSILIVLLLCGSAGLDTLAEFLNVRHMSTELPTEFRGIYDPAKYRRSLQYQREVSRFGTLKRTILLPGLLAFIFYGGFNAVDQWVRGFAQGPLLTGLFFVGALSLLRGIVTLPFSLYGTFVIEERYGFNRTTARTYAGDLLKGVLLGVLLGAPVFAAIQWFFESAGSLGWLYSWLGVTAFQLLVVFLAPVLLLPLFNKFSPLPEGPLKEAIERYASSEDFRIQGVYTMDGSRRSTKSNAFFTGFGPFRRLVLFDTLIEKQSVEELTAVVAHEIGHFKRGHILKGMLLSTVVSCGMFYVMSLFLDNAALFEAFRMQRVSVYASLVFIGLLYGPVLRPLSVLSQLLSRRFEYEADEYSARTYHRPEELVAALKKLSIDNLSNLTPHRLKIWLDYTHPPVLERIRALRQLAAEGGIR
jgi:STE24 endopeptidase